MSERESYDANGKTKSVDADAGGGVTSTPAKAPAGPVVDQRNRVAGDPVVTISGNANYAIPGQNGSFVPLVLGVNPLGESPAGAPVVGS